MKDVSESLAGRVGVLNLYSLSLSEINQTNFALFQPEIEILKTIKINNYDDSSNIFVKIFNGGMPSIVANTIARNNYFSYYINTYIERDIR